MGGFFLVAHSPDTREAGSLYAAGIHAAFALTGKSPSAEASGQFVRAAMFPRERVAPPPLATDEATGSWLLVAGTCFSSTGRALTPQQLLDRYLQLGAGAVADELEGFFVVVIADQRKHEVSIITDIAGSYHAFLRQFENTLVVSSSSLVAAAVRPSRLDPVACQEFLYCGNIYEDRSLWLEVRKLPPASILRIRDGKIVDQSRYWRLENLNPTALTGDEALAQYWSALTGAGKKIAQEFANPACDLTGGFDSRVLAAGLLGANARFSAVVSGNDGDPDVEISRRLAAMAGVPHQQMRPAWPEKWSQVSEVIRFTDGEANSLEYFHVLRVHRQLAAQFDISLNGSFGEIARGAWWDLLPGKLGEVKQVDPALIARSRFVPGMRFPMLDAKDELNLPEHFTGVVERANAPVRHLPNTAQIDNAYLFIRMQRWQGRLASSTNRIWPCLSPFLFRSVMEVVLSVDWRDRQNDSLFRRLLARYSRKFGNVALDRGTPAVPLGITNFYRFAGIGSYYWKRLRGRWRRRHGGGPAAEVQQRLTLWSDPELRSILDPKSMRLAALLPVDIAQLSSFLERSTKAAFPYERQWGRLATLESACRAASELWGNSSTAKESPRPEPAAKEDRGD